MKKRPIEAIRERIAELASDEDDSLEGMVELAALESLDATYGDKFSEDNLQDLHAGAVCLIQSCTRLQERILAEMACEEAAV